MQKNPWLGVKPMTFLQEGNSATNCAIVQILQEAQLNLKFENKGLQLYEHKALKEQGLTKSESFGAPGSSDDLEKAEILSESAWSQQSSRS
ncbi:hypothetical protein ATANTOWER_021067 [Ataeniobius toweri]|uniref:Uncharacterized protein n=1 Tax=Ataeniobius toweri TaxID=208326 RepID=A0ABU7CBE4_9TELE|nr:hypothetical protein [Ataeniobius toweri]